MASIDKEMIQKQLNKSIEILEMTFDKFKFASYRVWILWDTRE